MDQATHQSPQRKVYVFNVKKDIVMLKEVVTINPYDPDGRSWGDVLKQYNDALNKYGLSNASDPSERTLSERVSLLIEKFNVDDLNSLRASGTDEEESEREVLIRKVKGLKQAAEELAMKKKEDKKREEEIAKEKRKRAMDDSTEEGEDKGATPSKRKKKTTTDSSLIDYFREKSEREAKLKEIELNQAHERAMLDLKLREKELELREREKEKDH